MRIWFNKNISSLFDVLDVLKQHSTTNEFEIIVTHPDKNSPSRLLADHFEIEPSKINDREYLRYCLQFAKQERIDLFYPGKQVRNITLHANEFEEQGTHLLSCCSPENYDLIEDKVALYQSLPKDVVHLPDYLTFKTVEEFQQGFAKLSVKHSRICFKPVSSIFGMGFRIIEEPSSPFNRLMYGDGFRISYDHACECFQSNTNNKSMMLMQYLSGYERSVDCLARNGQLIAGVVRRKIAENLQEIETNTAILESVRQITSHLKLNAIFNVQFRDDDHGVPHLLEINSRMSGGLFYSCSTGFCFPYWALKNAAFPDATFTYPEPKTGYRVVKVNRAVFLS